MELIKLYDKKGKEAIVEKDSQAEKEMKELGFSPKKAAKTQVKAESK